MGSNEGWPEAFGFSVNGGAPVIISSVEEEGSAQAAGLQPGDVIAELDGEDVQQWDLEQLESQVLLRARGSAKVPPSLVVISRVRQFRIRRDGAGGFGLTVRGDCPVFVRSVDVPSPARAAGLRSGDLLLEVGGRSVRQASKSEVLALLRASGDELALTVVTGGLDWSISAPPPLSSGPSSSSLLSQSLLARNRGRLQRATIFHNKVSYYLMGEPEKKTHLLTLMRLYAGSRDVDSLAGSLDLLLEGPIQRRLIPAVRDYLQPRHRARFDILTSSSLATPTRRKSVDVTRPLAATRGAPWASSLPSLAPAGAGHEKQVRVDRRGGGFGFSLSGNAPVFVRSVDPGGPAELAGLRAGDTLLAINGLSIRTATHSHVVRLLRGSGKSPSLLVSSPLPERPSSSRWGVGGASHRGGVAPPLLVRAGERGSFQQKVEQVLQPRERQKLMTQLEQFSRQKDIPKLVEGLQVLLSDPGKMQLFHHICQLLPAEAQAEFDRLAAASLGGGGSEEVLEDTAIGSVGEDAGFVGGHGILGPLMEGGEGVRGRENSVPQQQEAPRVKRRSLENTPVGQTLTALLNGTPLKRGFGETTPITTPTNDITTCTTPGTVPPPPPTPVVGPGGIPLPPPPPPSSSFSSKPLTKRVNWQKMARTDGTVWGELSGLEEAVELAELETQFALRKSKESSERIRNKKPSVLDSKKAYNISILLRHLKLPAEAIKQAVLACDHSVLGEQHIRLMAAFAPDKKEVEPTRLCGCGLYLPYLLQCLGLTRYYDNPSILGLPDQFSCEMSTIPCYRERLEAMLFKMHYREKIDEIRPDLEAICQASVQLQKSKRFKKLLELVLAIGNHMNMGNVRIGQAQGFRIGFLAQLRGLRTTDGRSTLLHFLAGLTERKFPQVLDFHEDLPACSRAARVSGQTLEAEVNELAQGLKDIKRDIREVDSRDELPGDRFHDVMSGFLVEAEGETADLLSLYSRMMQEFRQIVQFYGEDPGKMRIDDFFSIFASFSTDFQKAVSENRQARQREVEEERRLELGTARRRGQTIRPHPSDEDQYSQFKEELEKTRLRPIPQRPQSRTEQRPQQTNFTHMLRPVRNGTKTATPTKQSPHDNETFF